MTNLSDLINRNGSPAAIVVTGAGSFVKQDSPTINDGIYNGSQTSALGTTPSPNIDLSTGIFFVYSMAGNVTFALSNIPSGFCSFCLRITYTSGVATWTNFTNLKWDGGAAPTFEAGHVYDIVLTTTDTGSNWTGQIAGDFS